MKHLKKILIVVLVINLIALIVLIIYKPKKEELEVENQIQDEILTQDMILSIDNFGLIAENYDGELVLLYLRTSLKKMVDSEVQSTNASYVKSEALEGTYVSGIDYDSFILRVYLSNNGKMDFKVQYSNYKDMKPAVLFERIGE